jgi:hypothetical protein
MKGVALTQRSPEDIVPTRRVRRRTEPRLPLVPEYPPKEVGSSPTPSGVGGFVTRFQYVFLTAAMLGFFILGWRGRAPVLIGTNDESTYLALSRSIEAGSYREIFMASAPLHVRFPPAYPAWLAAVRQVTGENLDLIQGVNLGLVILSLVCLYLIVRQVAGVPIALTVSFLTALSPPLLNSGGTLLSEPLFFALVACALVCTIKTDSATSRHAYLAMAFALAAFLTRTAGITVVLAIGIWLWHRRRRTELLAYVMAGALVVGGWFAYTASVPPASAGWSYAAEVSGQLGADPERVAGMVPSAWANAIHYGTRYLPSFLGIPRLADTSIDNVVWVVVQLLLLSVGTLVFWRKSRVVALFVFLYGGLLLVWPWGISRLLIPLLPYLLAALLIGAYQLTRSLPAVARGAALAALVLLLSVGAVRGVLARDARARACERNNPIPSEQCYNVEARSIASAALFLREHAPPGSVVLTYYPPVVNFVSGHLTEYSRIVGRIPQGQAARVLRERGIGYVLLSRRLGPVARNLLLSCRELTVEGRFPPNAFVISMATPSDPSQNACGVLTEFLTVRRPTEDQ